MLVERPFDETFVFTRPEPAVARDASGAPVAFDIDVPRFDHDADGNRKGLIVDRGSRFGRGDRLQVNVLDDWYEVDDGRMTVIHAYEDEAGLIVRRAWYSRDAVSTVNACLAHAVTHRLIAAYPGWLRNRDGFVLVANQRWQLATLIGDAGGVLTDTDGRPLLGG